MYTTEIIKDKFWILEDAGVKLGTIRKKDDSDFEVIIRNEGIEILGTDALTTKYGSSILEQTTEMSDFLNQLVTISLFLKPRVLSLL